VRVLVPALMIDPAGERFSRVYRMSSMWRSIKPESEPDIECVEANFDGMHELTDQSLVVATECVLPNVAAWP
jgi:hypothetical protein